jgi:hypothetical protein
MDTSELMKTIVKKTGDFEDEIIFLHIFNKLTNNGKTKNYSHNSNGVFFDLTKIDKETLNEILEDLENYKYTKEEVEKTNLDREKIIIGLKKEVSHLDSCVKTVNKLPNNVSIIEDDYFSDDNEENISFTEEVKDTDSVCSNELFGYCSE